MGDWAVLHRRLVAVLAAVVVVAFAVVLHVRAGSPFTLRAIDDIGEAVAAGIAVVPCLWRALRSTGRARLSWVLVGGALAAWSAGEVIWSYYELISDRETPFPSFADIGFLLFPVLALAGLLVRPRTKRMGRGRINSVLDGTIVVSSVFIISAATSLGAVWHASSAHDFAFGVGLAYPISDVVLVSVAILLGIRTRAVPGLLLLVGGLVSMSIADSAFAYLTAKGTYHTGAVSDVAWVAAFLMIGLSALYPQTAGDKPVSPIEPRLVVVVPYVLVMMGVAAGVGTSTSVRPLPVVVLGEGISLLALVGRHLVTVLDNRRLAMDVLAQRAELEFRAFHDALTGLANRALFYDRVAHALELHRRDMRPVSLMFIDLDDFKAVNDSYGHDAGDALLVAVAQRLNGVVRTGDTIARLGGDEFAILLEDDGATDVLAERVLAALAEPVTTAQRDIPVHASIGTTTLHPADGHTDIDELLKRADLAMYAAKRGGKGTAVAYTAALRTHMDDDLDERLSLAHDIDARLVRTAFQRIVRCDGQVYGFEALARWHYRGADIEPEHFIALAERTGLLTELDLLMVRNALSAMQRSGGRQVMSVNLGLRRAQEFDVVHRLEQLIVEHACSPRDLVIEIVETEALEEAGSIAAFHALRELGVGVAIDDFGIGYSNFSRLTELRPDIVKLDRSLIAPLDEAGTSTRLLAAVIDIAHDLDAIVVGEGVETQRQLATLRELGCDAMQGFLIGAPTWVPVLGSAIEPDIEPVGVG